MVGIFQTTTHQIPLTYSKKLASVVVACYSRWIRTPHEGATRRGECSAFRGTRANDERFSIVAPASSVRRALADLRADAVRDRSGLRGDSGRLVRQRTQQANPQRSPANSSSIAGSLNRRTTPRRQSTRRLVATGGSPVAAICIRTAKSGRETPFVFAPRRDPRDLRRSAKVPSEVSLRTRSVQFTIGARS